MTQVANTLIPSNSSCDLGSPTQPWRNIYASNPPIPVGTITMWGGSMETDVSKIPEGWLLCDGSKFYYDTVNYIAIIPSGLTEITIGKRVFTRTNISDINKLLQVIGSKWGHGEDEYGKYWNLPDLQQRFPLGAKDGSLKNGFRSNGNQIEADTNLGAQGGDSEVALSVLTMPSHYHKITAGGGASNSGNAQCTETHESQMDFYSGATGGNKAHSNMPPYLAVNFIIKY